MCRFISFLHNPRTFEIFVSDLSSHSRTEAAFPSKNLREGHYLPDGTIECRVLPEDGVSQETCNKMLRERFPRFVGFFNWCLKGTNQLEVYHGNLWFTGLTTADGLVLPKKIHGDLWLGLTTADGLVLPKKIHGNLWLTGLTTAEGVVPPEKIHGDLHLNSLTSTDGLELPEEIHGDLHLDSLTSTDGLELPKKIHGSL